MEFKPGDWIEGPFWQNTVQIIHIQPQTGYDVVTVYSRAHDLSRPYILTKDDWQQVKPVARASRTALSFDGDPVRFRLAIQAQRLKLAHAIDPYAGLNSSRVDPLPHQFEAVYKHMLARPVVRNLLAHDAGAGKTIMAGLLIKELKRRQNIKRVLIVSPAGLTIQWKRELLTKFGEDFSIISREYMDETRLDRLDVWRNTNLAITSVAFARQREMCRALETVEWDLVIVDEAHKLAAYRKSSGSIEKTQAYELGKILSRRAKHFLLMTATPHKGDPENYRLLIRLIDPEWGDASAYAPGSNPLVLRRTKEEMRTADGRPLYPERIVETLSYSLSHDEGEMLEQVYKFIRRRFEKAKSSNKQSAAFALMTLSRRLASSPSSLLCSLRRIKAKAEAGNAQMLSRESSNNETVDLEDWDDLSDEDRNQSEQDAEAQAAQLVDLHQLETLITKTEALAKKGSQKIVELRKAVGLWVGERKKQLIIFTEFKDTLDDLDHHLKEWGYTTTQIHGGMAMEDRRAAEKIFWQGKVQVLVATEAAGEGINLQCCNVMINFDLPWNPTRLEQRMGRIHRYGQKEPQVFIFNLLARNSMEDQVKETLLTKLKEMRKDLGDKVFDVVGAVLWGEDLRSILERVALGDITAVEQARQAIESAEQPLRTAINTEREITATSEPLDIAAFQQNQAQFKAYRLSPEDAEEFLRAAVPFVGGTLREFTVPSKNGNRPAFEVILPLDLGRGKVRRRKLCFWPEACSDDDTDPEAVLFISPGSTLFDQLVEKVLFLCRDDLARGATYFDIHPDSSSPYLVWFIHTFLRDGLNHPAGEFLTALRHRADQEKVERLPSEALNGFDFGSGHEMAEGVQRVRPMLAGQREVVDQCVQSVFLPDLIERRKLHKETVTKDCQFLTDGLNHLIEYLNDSLLEAYGSGDDEEGARIVEQMNNTSQRVNKLQVDMTNAGHLAILEPEVLGVALVLPAPIVITPDEAPQGKHGTSVSMRRNPEVEKAAMKVVMDLEEEQGRYPKDVSKGKSWDIESFDIAGKVVRYIEVKGRGPGEAEEVWLTEPEWEAARRLGDQHWLYIVRLEDGMKWMIQNPYLKLHPKEMKRWVVSIDEAAEVAGQSGPPAE